MSRLTDAEPGNTSELSDFMDIHRSPTAETNESNILARVDDETGPVRRRRRLHSDGARSERTVRRRRSQSGLSQEERGAELDADAHRQRRRRASEANAGTAATPARQASRTRRGPRINGVRVGRAGRDAICPAVLPEELYIGPMDRVCSECHAVHFKHEQTSGDANVFSRCCGKGKVKIHDTGPVPDELMKLYDGRDTERSFNFLANIRRYNAAMAFASIRAQKFDFQGGGPMPYKIYGQVYHSIGGVMPADGRQPKYGQLYFLESAVANRHRLHNQANQDLRSDTIERLEAMMQSVNPFARIYKSMREVDVEESTRALMENRPRPQIKLVLDQGPTLDPRRYNAPTVSEVAGVMIGDENHGFSEYALVIHARQEGLKTISSLNGLCDPLSYPLLFPSGSIGRSPSLMSIGSSHKVSTADFYCYRLAVRPIVADVPVNLIHYGRFLFQQYIVDAYVKVESENLHYIRRNQAQLRVESYQGLSDYVATTAANMNVAPGRIVVLPSSFKNGPRYMNQAYQDAMAICRRFGKPDLFITMTCNPDWPEIRENLLPNQAAFDRPDIVASVFGIKMKLLIEDLNVNHVFGRVLAYTWVVEFQKRGLPHCHILLILHDEDKPRNADDVDKIISAEIPDPTSDPRLYGMVAKMMMHGPCGAMNRSAPCMQNSSDGTCGKNFPKQFRESTTLNDNGFPAYRRRDTGRMVAGRGQAVLNNQFVVPYCLYLLAKYNCHLNVEFCSTVKSFKYLYKYVFKGHDRAQVRVEGNTDGHGQVLDHDEVLAFLNCRYVSPAEAAYRLFGISTDDMSHHIERLCLHMPNQQNVYFQHGREESALHAAPKSKLMAWFELNQADEAARSILYHDIPEHYTWIQKDRRWKKRQRGAAKTIGRVYSVSPRNMELYCLRVLLLHSPGATSFTDLISVNGQPAATFHEAARLRELLQDDNEWNRAMTAASEWQMPNALRQLFVIILEFGSPSNPLQLWTAYKNAMSEDYARDRSAAIAEAMTYQDIDRGLRVFGKSLAVHFGIPEPMAEIIAETEEHGDREEQRRTGLSMYNRLTASQKSIADAVLSSLHAIAPAPRCFFVDGPGGTGKTFLYTCLSNLARGQGWHVIAVAWTGIAANLLPNGCTVHSRFKLPLCLDENSVLNLSASSREARQIRSADLILWDEAPMAPKTALTVIDRGLRDICQSDVPFGGKVLVLGGDFRQVLPVVRRGGRAEQVNASIKGSDLWHLFKQQTLSTNMRVDDDQSEFSDWLLRLGNGELGERTAEGASVSVPRQCIVSGDLVADIFGSTISASDIVSIHTKVILCPVNDDALKTNEQVLCSLPGVEEIFSSHDKAVVDDGQDAADYPLEFLHSLTPNGLPPHNLRLKIGAIVMLLRNLDINQGLCNGTRLRVVRHHRNVLDCELLTGSYAGRRVLIPRITLEPTGELLPFRFERRQFPVRLAFAMTINKSQGQTFNKVGVLLQQPVFSHGQLYVAASRVRNFSSLRIKLPDDVTQVKNIVYREIFE